jgi:putative endonuclease
MSNSYCVYILANRSRSLYIGVSGNIERRLIEHRDGVVAGFTTRYRIFRLVHLETFGDVRDAIAREKEIKRWRREKKIRLIERKNPGWADLAESMPTVYKATGRSTERRQGAGAEGKAESQANSKAKSDSKAKADPSPR